MRTRIDEPLLTAKQAADRAGLQESTIRKWIWSRKIVSYRVGRARRVKWSDIEAVIDCTPALD